MFECVLLSLLLITLVNCRNSCENTTYNLTVLQTFDGELEEVRCVGKIALEKDSFGLYLKNETIPKLCENLVEIEVELSVVQISNCGVRQIEKKAFKVVPTLTLLRISNNLLTDVSTGVFNEVKVKEIDLSYNLINNIEEEAFDNVTNLEIVKLNNNLIKRIDGNWFKNTSIYKLSIIYNELTEITEGNFKNFVRSKGLKLRLSANQIYKIEASSFGYRNLDKLRLNGNKLRQLPSDLCSKNNTIKELQVNTNDLKCFPEDLFVNCGLRKLEFFENAPFECNCLKEVRKFVEKNNVTVIYPSIICEDRKREINVVYNLNRTQEIPLILSDVI